MLGYPSAHCFARRWQIVLIAAALAMLPRPAHAAACDDAMDWNSVMDLEKEAASLRSQVVRATIPLVRDEREAVASADLSAHAHALNEQLGLLELASSIAETRAKLGTAINLVEAQQSMRSEGDRAVLRRMIRKLAPSAVDAAESALAASDEVAFSTQRRSIKLLAADIRKFLARTRDAFQACVDPVSIAL
jgi:hypothetical protein